MAKVIQLLNISKKELQESINEVIETKIQDLKQHFTPKEPPKYVTRNYVADEMLHCDLSTVHNLCKKGILQKYQCGGRVLFKRAEVEKAIVKLKK